MNAGEHVGARQEVPSVRLLPKIAAMLPGASGEVPGAKLALLSDAGAIDFDGIQHGSPNVVPAGFRKPKLLSGPTVIV